MSFLESMFTDARIHQDEILLLALLDAVDPSAVRLSIGDVPLDEVREELRQRVEANVAKNMERQMESAANEALGKPDFLSLFFRPKGDQ